LVRKDIERQIGHGVISSEKASDYLLPTDDVEVKEIEEPNFAVKTKNYD